MKLQHALSSLFASAVLILSSGCAPKSPLPSDEHYSSSAIRVPFVAPRSELCASSSIEMLSLYWQSVDTYLPRLSLAELDARTLIPAKGGTLQIELIAAARANGLLAYPLEPTFKALFAELEAGHPVVVLLNRAYSWYPLWHYAPITGYDAKAQTIRMHYADTPDEAVSLGTFAALWERSGNWGVVLLPPTELPASADAEKFLQAAYDLEKTRMRAEAITAYETALLRWPEDTSFLFAAGNAYYASHRLSRAEEYYRKIVRIDPLHSLALNNLADLLCRSGRSEEALELLDQAKSSDAPTQALIKATREEIGRGCDPLPKPVYETMQTPQ